MEEAAENGKGISHSAHAGGLNEYKVSTFRVFFLNCYDIAFGYK
jgi:hypothetical protein